MIELMLILLFIFCMWIAFTTNYKLPKGQLNDFGFTAFVIGAILATAGTAKSVQSQRRSASATRKAQEESSKRAQAADARSRSRQIREARATRAQAAQRIENQGAGGGSVEAGALGSIQTQLGSNLGFQSNQQASVLRQTALLGQASAAAGSAATAGAVAGLGQTLIGASNQFGSTSDAPILTPEDVPGAF